MRHASRAASQWEFAVRSCLGPRAVVALAGLLALVLVGAASVAAPTARAAGALTPATPATSAPWMVSPAQVAVERDSPAVARIVSVVSARLTCQACASDGSDIRSPADGSAFTFYSSGSGAFVAPGGAILTADHVVDHSMGNAEDVSFVEQQAAADIAQQGYGSQSSSLTYLQGHASKVSITFQVVFQKAFLSTAYTGLASDTAHIYAFPIASVLASSPVSQQDTAIVQIDTSGISPAPDFPFLTLSASPVNALDTVTAIAFPADADLALNTADFTALANPQASDVNTLNSLLGPSVNSGQITKVNEVRKDGTQVYEAGSIASNGSSGGPVINDQGEVIGFVDAGASTNRLTFIIPSAIAAKYTARAGIPPAPSGRFMALWTQALDEYNGDGACHWTTATGDLQRLSAQYPSFGAARQYLSAAKRNASAEACATPAPTPTSATPGNAAVAGLALIGGCIIAVIALILGVIFLLIALIRRGRKPRRGAPMPVTSAATALPIGAPAPPAHGAYAPGVAGVRRCPNGHVVDEPGAAFCPICGAPLAPPALR